MATMTAKGASTLTVPLEVDPGLVLLLLTYHHRLFRGRANSLEVTPIGLGLTQDELGEEAQAQASGQQQQQKKNDKEAKQAKRASGGGMDGNIKGRGQPASTSTTAMSAAYTWVKLGEASCALMSDRTNSARPLPAPPAPPTHPTG